MAGVSPQRAAETRAIERTDVRDTEQLFGSILTDIATLLWPTKTAANIAAIVGCTERAAEFYLSGKRQWSGAALSAIVAEVLRRHNMRNVKVIAKRN